MLISEIFYSIQGEGELTGVPSVFLRTSGCNLRCSWCDTKYASWNPEGDEMTVDELVEKVTSFPARHVVLTGGEPLVAKEMPELARRQWIENYPFQLKFVVENRNDIAEIEALIAAIGIPVPPHKVLLMPQGTDAGILERRQDSLVELCKSRGYRYCTRLHIALFGNTKGT